MITVASNLMDIDKAPGLYNFDVTDPESLEEQKSIVDTYKKDALQKWIRENNEQFIVDLPVTLRVRTILREAKREETKQLRKRMTFTRRVLKHIFTRDNTKTILSFIFYTTNQRNKKWREVTDRFIKCCRNRPLQEVQRHLSIARLFVNTEYKFNYLN